MVTYINETGVIGQVITTLSNNVTGSEYLTILLFLLLLAAILGAVRMPLEYIGMLLIPFIIVAMAFNTAFIGIGITILLFLSLSYAYYFFR